jgi:eukaryotic-like serine/threonine-protein kinase
MTAMTDESVELSAGTLVAEKYRIDGVLGRGGMGVVYAAQHVVTGKHVAIKCLDARLANASASARFIREAQAACRIAHPNVVDVYDIGRYQHQHFMVMERLRGETLRSRIKGGALAPEQVLPLIERVLEAIAVAHENGVIHRDLKPDNIFICKGEVPKIVDFGISKLVQPEMDPSLTKTGMVVGTPAYMAPEQLEGRADIDHRCDIYALGLILYEALTGKHPYYAPTYNAIVVKVATERPEPISVLEPAISPALESVVMKAMAKKADDRFSSATEMLQALRAGTPVAREPVKRRSWRPALMLAAGALVGLAAVVFTAGWWSEPQAQAVLQKPEPPVVQNAAVEPPSEPVNEPEPEPQPDPKPVKKRIKVKRKAPVVPPPTPEPPRSGSMSADEF